MYKLQTVHCRYVRHIDDIRRSTPTYTANKKNVSDLNNWLDCEKQERQKRQKRRKKKKQQTKQDPWSAFSPLKYGYIAYCINCTNNEHIRNQSQPNLSEKAERSSFLGYGFRYINKNKKRRINSMHDILAHRQYMCMKWIRLLDDIDEPCDAFYVETIGQCFVHDSPSIFSFLLTPFE